MGYWITSPSTLPYIVLDCEKKGDFSPVYSVKDFRVWHERLGLEIPSVLKHTTTAKHSPGRRIKEFTLSMKLCHGDVWLPLMGVFLRKNQGGLGFLFVLSLHHTSQVCRDMLFCLLLPVQIPAWSQVFNGDFPAHYLVMLWLSRVRRSVLVVFFPSLCFTTCPIFRDNEHLHPSPHWIMWEMRGNGGAVVGPWWCWRETPPWWGHHPPVTKSTCHPKRGQRHGLGHFMKSFPK